MIRLALLLSLLASLTHAETLRMAVTTSFHNSGLSDFLLPQIKEDTGLEVQLLIVGTGQALRLGEAGDVDAILVHSRKAEDAFIEAGHGTHRREIMYNDFVLVGPAEDPADINTAKSAQIALSRIARAGARFISRGDDSGTHEKERALWSGRLQTSDWYLEAGAGMGATLNMASALSAYTLTDRASWLNFANKGELKILYSGDLRLFNQYVYIPVNSAKHVHVKAHAAEALEDWLTSERAEKLINGYTLSDEQLFTFNAQR